MGFGKYVGVTIIGLLSMAAGSQLVHKHYQPLSDIEDYVQREIERRKKESGQ